jgi:signal transduction histidine kinase
VTTLDSGDHQLLIESLPGFVKRFGKDGGCEFCNQAWLGFTGRSLEEELGDGWGESVHEEDRARCLAAVRAPGPRELSYRLRRSDGEYLHVLERVAPTRAGRLSCGIEAQDRERFADLVAHELRTPVQALQGFLEAVRSRDSELIDLLHGQTDRLVRVIEALAEADGGPTRLQLAPLDLAELARECVAGLASERTDRSVVFRGPQEPLGVRGDGRRLFRALRDLLDNALKFSPGREEVAMSAFRDGDRCRVQVIDRGIGVPRAELPSLGQRWFRASNADWRMYPGLGLGLAIARETLRLHGGALSFESDAGQGMTATLSLPAA